jgi:phosphoribosylformylglycinamidine cyclo-ligase
LAHLTGGGFIGNIPRVLPKDLGACIRIGSWPVLPVFDLIQKRGDIPAAEMLRVFNMGIGMVVVVSREHAARFQAVIPEETWAIGEVRGGKHAVTLEGDLHG